MCLICLTENNIFFCLLRLARFLNLKKEASSFAGRLVEPVLLLLNGNGQVAVGSFPPQVYIFISTTRGENFIYPFAG